MDEFKFVLKCLIFSCLIVTFSQTRISGETLENKAYIFFKHSETAHWVRATADGGVKLIREGISKTQNFVSDKFGNGSSVKLSNTGLFRKLEKDKTQQRGETAESEIDQNEESPLEE